MSLNPPYSPSRPPLVRDVLVSAGLALVLVALASREGRLLTFDGYHYVEFAKQFSQAWPDRFGNHWPFGWPLAGGLLARLGIPAYLALVGLAALALVVLLSCAALVLGRHPARLAVLCAIGAAPVMAPQIGSCLTELPFAAALLGLGWCLAHWPHRGALWGAAGCAVVALCVRYAGLVALAMIGLTLLDRWRDLRAASRLPAALASLVAAGTVSTLLLWLNVLKSGHASGADRGGALGLASVYREIPSFGWSAPSALLAGGLRDRIGPETTLGLIIGSFCFALITAGCAWLWLRPRSTYSRPLVTVAFGYSAGMCVLHAVGDFDALYNSRTFLPALAPLAILAAERLTDSRVWLRVICLLVTAAGVVAAVRGTSRQIGGDVLPAVAALRARIGAGDRILINDHAMSVSAYFPQPTERVWAENWQNRQDRVLLVVAGKPIRRDGSGAKVTKDWVELAGSLVATGGFHPLIREPGLIVLEHPSTSVTAPAR